jgi:metal-responsive CopG/Arc/MetJ family transcriptional regulator
MNMMARTKKIIGLALDPKLLERLDKWRREQDVPPTKTAVHEAALREFLEKREKRERR